MRRRSVLCCEHTPIIIGAKLDAPEICSGFVRGIKDEFEHRVFNWIEQTMGSELEAGWVSSFWIHVPKVKSSVQRHRVRLSYCVGLPTCVGSKYVRANTKYIQHQFFTLPDFALHKPVIPVDKFERHG